MVNSSPEGMRAETTGDKRGWTAYTPPMRNHCPIGILLLSRLGRPVKLHDPPCHAIWVPRNGDDPISGLVHKGEEIIEQGRPRRYYHFVSDCGIERLAAEDLEFPGSVGIVRNQKLGQDFVIAFPYPDPQINDAAGSLNSFHSRPTGHIRDIEVGIIYGENKPLIQAVNITNTTGYERKVPVWTEPLNADEVPKGIRLVLQGIRKPVLRKEEIDEQVEPQETMTLLPGQRGRLFELDLNKHFKITESSTYRFEVTFEADSGLPVGSVSHEHYLQIEVRTLTIIK